MALYTALWKALSYVAVTSLEICHHFKVDSHIENDRNLSQHNAPIRLNSSWVFFSKENSKPKYKTLSVNAYYIRNFSNVKVVFPQNLNQIFKLYDCMFRSVCILSKKQNGSFSAYLIRDSISMGLMSSTKPINIEKKIVKPINLWWK